MSVLLSRNSSRNRSAGDLRIFYVYMISMMFGLVHVDTVAFKMKLSDCHINSNTYTCVCVYTTVHKLGVGKIFEIILLCSPRLK